MRTTRIIVSTIYVMSAPRNCLLVNISREEVRASAVTDVSDNKLLSA